MKKGFIFSLSTFYYVLLFLVFLSLFMVAYFNFSFRDKINDFNYSKKVNFFTNTILGTPQNNYWCGVYYKYDPNQDLRDQTIPEKIEYCEVYDKERFF
jgi:hypothetical protein